jgi:hypothetical protein
MLKQIPRDCDRSMRSMRSIVVVYFPKSRTVSVNVTWLGLRGCWVKEGFGVSRWAPGPGAAFDTSAICWVCAGKLGERGFGVGCSYSFRCVAKLHIP